MHLYPKQTYYTKQLIKTQRARQNPGLDTLTVPAFRRGWRTVIVPELKEASLHVSRTVPDDLPETSWLWSEVCTYSSEELFGTRKWHRKVLLSFRAPGTSIGSAGGLARSTSCFNGQRARRFGTTGNSAEFGLAVAVPQNLRHRLGDPKVSAHWIPTIRRVARRSTSQIY